MDPRAETQRALEEIRRMVKSSDLSQRKVEDRAGFSRGYLSQLLAKNLDLKLWHLLAILDVLGASPTDFFLRLYPQSTCPSLERFRSESAPVDAETEEILRRLYDLGPESLRELRERVAGCESAIDELRTKGAEVREDRGEG
jgi:transcriptional regulator with XRE-family HTH domain